MCDAFIPLHILLCDEVLLYFILRRSHLKFILDLNSIWIALYKKYLKI
jgi:hypothetical protein